MFNQNGGQPSQNTNTLLLDSDQKKIVEHLYGSALVSAGAGSGKTRVIVERSVRMIEQGISPKSILMLTFSRKTAREMYARTLDRLDNVKEMIPVIDTYHGFCFKTIRTHKELFGFTHTPSLIDESDAKKLMREISKEHDLKGNDHKLIYSLYHRFSDDLIWPYGLGTDLFEKSVRNFKLESNPTVVRDIYKAYDDKKRHMGVLDFSDVIRMMMFKVNKDQNFAQLMQNHFHHIVVDEVQDTNKAQFYLVKGLYNPKNERSSIVMVGDDDQCIYEWRGAQADNMRKFVEQLGSRVFKLERNYRSNTHIVKAASDMICNNQVRLAKNPYSTWDKGQKPIAINFDRSDDLADYMALSIKSLLVDGCDPKHIGILYRNNKQASAIEEALLKHGIPYHVHKGMQMASRAEVQLLFAYIRLINNPRDLAAFAKIAQTLDGIGPSLINHLDVDLACDSKATVFSLINTLAVSGKKKELLLTFKERAEKLSTVMPWVLPEWMMHEDGGNVMPYLDKLSKTANDAEKNRKQREANLFSMAEVMRARFSMAGIDDHDVATQWQIAMDMVLDSPDDETSGTGVNLMTVHKSKGLEFDHVFVAGFSDPFFGSGVFSDDEEEFSASSEEDRRLAYVAMTRARHSLSLLSCDRWWMGYETIDCSESPFLKEAGILTVRSDHKALARIYS
jgi:DNA helicase-2/ATP-dependent DNA helicase PcrA